MTRLQLRYLVQENVIDLLMKKMRAAAGGSEMPWEEFFEDFISHMLGIMSQITPNNAEKMMVAVKSSPRAGFEFIASHFVLEMKDNAVHRFIAVALANISWRSNLPQEIPCLAGRLLIKALTDHCRLEYEQGYSDACFNDPKKAYGGEVREVMSETDIQREFIGGEGNVLKSTEFTT